MVAVGPDRRAGIRRSSSGSLTCARKMPATGKELRISRRHATGDDPHGGKVFWDAALVRLNGCWPGRKSQIDGSFGGTAGVAEMLLQSHTGEVRLLPALPKAWPTASVKGLHARGAFEVDIQRKGGKLTAAALRSRRPKTCEVPHGAQVVDLPLKPGVAARLDGDLGDWCCMFCRRTDSASSQT